MYHQPLALYYFVVGHWGNYAIRTTIFYKGKRFIFFQFVTEHLHISIMSLSLYSDTFTIVFLFTSKNEFP